MPATSAILPLSSIPEERVRAYLRGRDMSDDIIGWKYYDAAFNRGRERGYAWVRDDEVLGFIGIVPFELALQDRVVPAAWFCDWGLADPKEGAGVGVRLLLRAIDEVGVMFGIAGSTDTRALVPRLAARTIDGACVVHELRVRPPGLRGLWERLRRWDRSRGEGRDAVEFCEGVAPRLATLLDTKEGGGDPLSDLAYLRWQLDSCPSLACFSALWPAEDAPRVGALCWHPQGQPRSWRMALWARESSEANLDLLLRSCVERIAQTGAEVVSVAASHRDVLLTRALQHGGFRETARWPLYLCKRSGVETPAEPPRLSFLANDLAYRFF